ncbi:MAG: MraY family glycosyltransferase [Planctomycetota bacterium]|jgi:UDP-GlcNAc:undecaprenyl-phosphate GlcNAc-1-phosphate transferase
MLIVVGGVFLMSLGLGVFLVHRIREWSLAHEFLDRPDERKAHLAAVPYGGGIAIFGATLAPVVAGLLLSRFIVSTGFARLWLPADFAVHLDGMVASATLRNLAVVWLGGLVLVTVGLVDDWRGLGPYAKLGSQIVVACFAAFAGDRITLFIGPGVGLAITVAWIVGITNAFNFLDNMDGLAAAVALVVTAILAIIAWQTGQYFILLALAPLAGALVAFLFFNFPPATIFMGDAGSTFVGYYLATIAVLTTFTTGEPGRFQIYPIAMPLLVFGLPIYDTASVTLLRLLRGASPLRADRSHFSHRLMALGLSKRQTLFAVALVTFALGSGAVVLPELDAAGAAMLLVQGAAILCVVATLEIAAARGASFH